LGYIAAWHHDVEGVSADVLNRMVITYTLPLGLFAGTVTTSRDQLTLDLRVGLILLVGMVVPFVATLLVARLVVRRRLAESTLQAMAIGLPAIPFVGLPVLGSVFGVGPATLTVGVGSLVTNLVIVPLSLIMLGVAAKGQTQRTTFRSVVYTVLSAFQLPMVWAPILGLALVLLDVHLPTPLVGAMGLLGSATAGVALFASGVVLRAYRPTFSLPVVVSTVGRLVVVPGLALAILPLFGLHLRLVSYPVVSLSLPSPVLLVILAVRFDVAERESASVLLYTYIFSAVTMAAFIGLVE